MRLEVFNGFGEVVKVLVDGDQAPGMYTVTWDRSDEQGRTVRNGIYLYRLTSPQGVLVRRMIAR